MNQPLASPALQCSPSISVIVPVRNAAPELRDCLSSLRASHFQDFEVIVVDDASTDATTAAAKEFGVHVLSLPRQSGPAYARNRGAEAARGDLLFFVDADVCVHPDTLDRVAETFRVDPGLAAVFGSYDAVPRAPSFLSQYRNLMHHFVHQEGSEEASTFWSGCGAIRRPLFLALGGFDEVRYRRPCIEDIELGVRLRKAGQRIRLNKQMLVTHLKRWTFQGILKADVRDRALPWTELIFRERALPDDLNLKLGQRLCVIFAFALVGLWLAGVWFQPLVALLPLFVYGSIVLIDRLGLTGRSAAWSGWLTAAGFAGVAVWLGFVFRGWAVLPAAIAAPLVLLNGRFYRFFARQRGCWFATLVFPMHFLYYLYSGASFGLGILKHLGQKAFPRTAAAPPPACRQLVESSND